MGALATVKKCIVFQCQNHTNEGRFVGDICFPCYNFIETGKGKESQVFRNVIALVLEAIKKINNQKE